MARSLARLWDDDRGAVISTELTLVTGLLVFGMIPCLVTMRNAVNAGAGTLGNTLNAAVPTFTHSGYSVGGQSGGNPVAAVNGLSVSHPTNAYLTASQVAPVVLNYNAIPVAP